LPSQLADASKPDAVHRAARHTVSLPRKKPAHDFRSVAPSHVRAAQRSAPPSSQAARGPCGTPLTALQVPMLPGTSQASH